MNRLASASGVLSTGKKIARRGAQDVLLVDDVAAVDNQAAGAKRRAP